MNRSFGRLLNSVSSKYRIDKSNNNDINIIAKELKEIGKGLEKDVSSNLMDLEDEFKKIDKNNAKASSILGNYNKTFNKDEFIEDDKKNQSKVIKEKDNEQKIDIEYFENKNPKTFGFNGIAGMGDLKKELNESFIKPLKFKFLVENFKKEVGDINNEKQKELTDKEKIYLELHETYEKFKVNIPTGMLFYGPPGTGKTFITKKLAEELGAGLIKKSVGEFASSYMHQTSQNIRKFFKEAKSESEKGPLILFLDEIDSLVSKRTNNIDSNKAEEVSQFLQEFNALSEAPNLIVMAATNRPDHLDSAIMRSGRLDKKIYIGPPDFEARKELFSIYIEKEDRPHKKLNYAKLAELTEGYVAADIENICDEASRNASKNILDMVSSITDIKKFKKKDISKIKQNIGDSIITMSLLKETIKETTSSIKYVDISIFDEWLKLEKI